MAPLVLPDFVPASTKTMDASDSMSFRWPAEFGAGSVSVHVGTFEFGEVVTVADFDAAFDGLRGLAVGIFGNQPERGDPDPFILRRLGQSAERHHAMAHHEFLAPRTKRCGFLRSTAGVPALPWLPGSPWSALFFAVLCHFRGSGSPTVRRHIAARRP